MQRTVADETRGYFPETGLGPVSPVGTSRKSISGVGLQQFSPGVLRDLRERLEDDLTACRTDGTIAFVSRPRKNDLKIGHINRVLKVWSGRHGRVRRSTRDARRLR